MLPFPILLDSDGKIQNTFGVTHWPTTILFDPEGKLVGEIQPDELEKKLKPVPLAVALPRQLDRNTNIYFDNPTLKQAFANLKMWTRAEFELDRDALKSLAQGEETKIPLDDQRAGLAPQRAGIAAGPGRPGGEGRAEGVHHHAQAVGRRRDSGAAERLPGPVRRADRAEAEGIEVQLRFRQDSPGEGRRLLRTGERRERRARPEGPDAGEDRPGDAGHGLGQGRADGRGAREAGRTPGPARRRPRRGDRAARPGRPVRSPRRRVDRSRTRLPRLRGPSDDSSEAALDDPLRGRGGRPPRPRPRARPRAGRPGRQGPRQGLRGLPLRPAAQHQLPTVHAPLPRLPGGRRRGPRPAGAGASPAASSPARPTRPASR